LIGDENAAPIVRDLLTTAFLERVMDDDLVVRFSDSTLEGHSSILISQGRRELGEIEPAVVVVRELSSNLNLR